MASQSKDINNSQGKAIVTEAASWKGTAYAEIGPASTKGKTGDCSGSTFFIYKAAGVPYAYARSGDFREYAAKSGLFRKLLANEAKQDGDVLSWPNHMAIYSTFSGDLINATTDRINAAGQRYIQKNDMWTAFNAHSQTPYGPFKMVYFRPDAPEVYRYQNK